MERFALAAANGFKAVEFWFPYDWPASQIAEKLREHGLQLIGLNTAPGDTENGEWGLAIDPARRVQFQAGVRQALDYAQALDCKSVHVMAGMRTPSLLADTCGAVYLENIAFAADLAAQSGRTILVEPLNPIDRPHYWMNRQSQARELIDTLGRPNLKIMFDLYHVQMTEGRITDTLKANLAHIGHIQVADVPGRGEPGTGELNYPYLFDQIEKSGYSGWVGCEYKPRTTTIDGLGWREAMKLGIA